MKIPTLELRVDRGRAYCGRPGCETRIGPIGEGGLLDLVSGPREGWVLLGPMMVVGDAAWFPPIYVLKRSRSGIGNTLGVPAGSVVECPRCRTRQVVPESPLT